VARAVGVNGVLPRMPDNRAMTHLRPLRTAGAGVLVAALALVAAGCGGSPKAAVASLGHDQTTTTAQSAAAPGSGPGGGYSQALAYAQCMRSHGVPDFPDPNAQGGFSIRSGPGSDLNPSSSQFQAADKVCQKLMPNGGQASPAQQARALAQALKFSQCMRAHGITGFPDPQRRNGGISISIKAGSGSNLDPHNPQFQAAQQACQGLLPGGGPQGSRSVTK
jgi:hypothetical protein